MFKDTNERPYVPPSNITPSSSGVERLNFDLSPRLQSAIEAARDEVEGRTKSLCFDKLQYHRYGKNFIKKKSLSPDAIMQLSFQVQLQPLQYRTNYHSLGKQEQWTPKPMKYVQTHSCRFPSSPSSPNTTHTYICTNTNIHAHTHTTHTHTHTTHTHTHTHTHTDGLLPAVQVQCTQL